MAGVSFSFSKLSGANSLLGLTKLSMLTTLAAAGPWLLTVLALALISSFGKKLVSPEELFEFRAILIYNFAFSLILASPFCMASARFLADSDYHHQPKAQALNLLWSALSLIWLMAWPLSLAFYILMTSFPPWLVILSCLNFCVLSGLWITMSFVAARNNYVVIAISFAIGLALAILISLAFASSLKVSGLLLGATSGLCIVLLVLLRWVFQHEFCLVRQSVRQLVQTMTRYRLLVLSGLIFNIGIWADKWIMWIAPEAQKSQHGLVVYPTYDSAMFLAYLAMVPAMALFFYHSETGFRPLLKKFLTSIHDRLTYSEIEACHLAIIHYIVRCVRSYVLLLGMTLLLGAVLAPTILPLVGGTHLQLGIFRYGLLGACFQILTLFMTVILINYDDRVGVFKICLTSLFANLIVSSVTLTCGFPYYGMGFFFASFIAFLYALIYFLRRLQNAIALTFSHC